MVKTFFTDEDKRTLRGIAEELKEICKLIDELAEKFVNLSDKELMKNFNASLVGFKENEVLRREEKLEEQIESAEKEFRSKNLN